MTLPHCSAATDTPGCKTPSAPIMPPKTAVGLREIVDRYDGFIIDIWGVLHDGGTPYDGAAEALRRLKSEGKKIALLSNSSQIVPVVIEELHDIGFDESLYDSLITSGELVGWALRDEPSIWRPECVGKVFIIGASWTMTQFRNSTLKQVKQPERAGVILNAWYDNEWGSGEGDGCAAWYPDMERWIGLGLPMICVNPDREVIHFGSRVLCPGLFAEAYEARGGKVHYYGKPHAPAYKAATQALGLPPEARIAMIGDNLATDIKGGADYSLDTILITGGVHCEALQAAWGSMPAQGKLIDLCTKHNLSPTWAMPCLAYDG